MERTIRISSFALAVFLFFSITVCDLRAEKVDDLIGKLSDKDGGVRAQAAEELGKLKDKRAIEALVDLLENREIGSSYKSTGGASSSEAAKKVAAAKLAVGRGPVDLLSGGVEASMSELQKHAKALKSRSTIDRRNAAEALGDLGDKRAVPALISAFKADRFGSGQEAILEALGKIGDPRAFELMIGALAAKSSSTRRGAAKALGLLGDPRAAEPLYAAVLSDSFMRRDGIEALAKLGTSEGIRLLNEAAKHKDVFVSRDAQEALDQMGPNHGLDPLINLLRDDDPAVVKLAAQALGEIGDSAAATALEGLATYGSEATRAAAKRALTQTGGGMIEASQEDMMAEMARMKAATALGEIGGLQATEALIRALKDKSEIVARSAGRALGQMKGTAVMRQFNMAVSSSNQALCIEAVQGLGLIGNADAIGLLTRALQHRDRDVRTEAIKALGNTRNPLAVEPLGRILGQDSFYEKEAVIALGAICDSSAVDPLISALKSSSFSTRREAVVSLGIIGDKRAVGPLVEVLKTQDHTTAKQAIEALGIIGDIRAAEGLVEVLGNRSYKKDALAVLEQLKWQPTTIREKVMYYIATERWQDCVKLGTAALDPLMAAAKRGNSGAAQALGDIGDKRAIPVLVDMLRDWTAGRQCCEALEKLGWKPQSLSDEVYMLIGKRDREALKSLYARNSQVKTILLNDLNSDSDRGMFVAAQTFIGLARTDMIPQLMSRLRTIKEEHVAANFAELLLNSGNEELSRQAKQWAESKGYRVVSSYMPGAASWGRW